MAKYIVIEYYGLDEMFIFADSLKHSVISAAILASPIFRGEKLISAGKIVNASSGSYCTMGSVSLNIVYSTQRNQLDNKVLERTFRQFI